MTIKELNELVTDGSLHTEIYKSPEIFEDELEKIFYNGWVYVAHESEVAEPGDYKTTFIGKQPVIVSRGSDDKQIHVMFNRCRHRGATVCQSECGNANYFRCAYHGWTFSNSGKLTGMPFKDGYGDDIRQEDLGLTKVSKIGIYQGFIFASINPDVEPIEDYLAQAKPYLDEIAKFGPEGIALDGGVHKYKTNANWKFQLENTIDPYHLAFVHRSFFELLAEKTGTKYNFNTLNDKEYVKDLGNGHSAYELSESLGIGSLNFNLIIFPNLGFVGSQVRHIHPISVEQTHVNIYPMMRKGASKEENAELLRIHERFYGPAGHGTVDDLEVAFDRVREGLNAKGNPWLDISRGMSRQKVDENGVVYSNATDEISTRSIYKQWRKMML